LLVEEFAERQVCAARNALVSGASRCDAGIIVEEQKADEFGGNSAANDLKDIARRVDLPRMQDGVNRLRI
jgi:hypothetical protein